MLDTAADVCMCVCVVIRGCMCECVAFVYAVSRREFFTEGDREIVRSVRIARLKVLVSSQKRSILSLVMNGQSSQSLTFDFYRLPACVLECKL